MNIFPTADVELIRTKGALTYEEAIALLEKHDGSVAHALADLESTGRLKSDEKAQPRQQESKHFFSRLYRFRIKVTKGSTIIANLSILFGALMLLSSPHLVIVAALIGLALGYHISFDKQDPDFMSDDLEEMARGAARKVKDSINS